MYVRDRLVLRKPAYWLNTAIWVVNIWLGMFLLIALAIALLALLPDDARAPLIPALRLTTSAFGIITIVAVPTWFAFKLGIVKCPCCASRFTGSPLAFTLNRRCGNCGFDVQSVSRQGDF